MSDQIHSSSTDTTTTTTTTNNNNNNTNNNNTPSETEAATVTAPTATGTTTTDGGDGNSAPETVLTPETLPLPPKNTTTTTTGVLALCCSVCNSPIATATDLLPHQIPRLESASYPYTLDLLVGPGTDGDGGGECWVYSATNPNQTRFDVVRFGRGACRRVHVYGEPTAEHTFFPPHVWRMASCPRCWAHLGWSFGRGEGTRNNNNNNNNNNNSNNNRDEGSSTVDAEGDEDPDCQNENQEFLGLILTKLREKRIDETDLDHVVGLVKGIASRLEELEGAMVAMEENGVQVVQVTTMEDDEEEDSDRMDADIEQLLDLARSGRDSENNGGGDEMVTAEEPEEQEDEVEEEMGEATEESSASHISSSPSPP